MAVCDVVVWLLTIGVCSGVLHDVCHSNTAGLTPQQVVNNLTECSDRDNNSVITPAEVALCFTNMMGVLLPFPESLIVRMPYQTMLLMARLMGDKVQVARDRFVALWTERFHDSDAFSAAFFDLYDSNNNAVWELTELDGIVQAILNSTATGRGSQEVTSEEFADYFLTQVYGDGC